MSTDARADVATALAVLACEDSYDLAVQEGSGAAVTEPALDARLAKDWAVAGVIVGTDSLWRKGCALLKDETVFYGWLLRHQVANTFLCLIRGTAGIIEWAEDAEGDPITVPGVPGKVERGFHGVYASMRLRHPGGADMPLVAGITAIVGLGTIIVAGHSLGAALATYLAADLADPSRLGARVSARIFCSPRPGDGEYIKHADSRLTDCVAYADALDIVTHVPVGLGYASLSSTQTLWPIGKIELGVKALHHVLSIAWLLCQEAVDVASLPPIDKPFIDCLRLRAA